MKLKLTKKQSDSLRAALLKEQQTKQAFNIARAQAADAENSRMTLLELVIESHGLDPETVANKPLNLTQEGVLTFGENGTASDRIKKELNRGALKSAAQKKAAQKKGKTVQMTPTK